MSIKINEIAYYLPEQIITNEELQERNPTWDLNMIEKRTGVVKRHVAYEHETALDMSFETCKNLFSLHKEAQEKIDGIIFCTQSQDYIIPPNACILHKRFGWPDSVFALDINMACSGYIYGLAIIQGLVSTGVVKNALLVNADTYSKYIHKKDRSASVLFGDGAAVSWISASDKSSGLVDIQCETSGINYERFIIPAGGCRMPKSDKRSIPESDNSGNVRTKENINMDGIEILRFVNSRIPKQIHMILKRNMMTIDDIDLFVFHQASKTILDSLRRQLKIKSEKFYQGFSDIGNTVSASIPIALKDALDCGKIVRGDKVLISGFGAGLSWGTAIINI